MDEYQLAYVVTTWIILATLLISTVFWWSRQPKNLPPSPGICLPIIGHLYLLDAKNSRKQFKEWGEKIGRIFSLQMGASRYIVLNDFQLIKNLTIKHADTMTGRSTVNVLSQYVPSRFRGLIVSSGPLWKEQRATAMTILRNLGMGKSVLAEKISQEVSVYVRELSLLKGRPSNIKTLTNMSVSNVISSVIFGRRFEFDDPFFIKTVGQFNVLVELAATVSLANFLPFLIYLPFDIFGGRRLINTYRELQKCNEYMVEKVRTEFDPESGDNFIFSYIREMEKKEKSGQHTHLSLENLARCIDDLFVAGTETTSSTILWCLLYSIHHPGKQEKVYQEIIEQVGTERVPNMMDKQNLKYLNAFIMETQRIASIAPIITYECTADTTFETYSIPKGTQIASNLDSVLRNQKVWRDPENFRPERFINGDGKLQTPEEFIPFSVGRRVCLGESLAKTELFLYMSSLFQKFKFLPEDENNLPSLEDTRGIT